MNIVAVEQPLILEMLITAILKNVPPKKVQYAMEMPMIPDS